MFQQFCSVCTDARNKGDENPISSVVAETIKLLANSSYAYQTMDQTRNSNEVFSDEKRDKEQHEQNVYALGLYKQSIVWSTACQISN